MCIVVHCSVFCNYLCQNSSFFHVDSDCHLWSFTFSPRNFFKKSGEAGLQAANSLIWDFSIFLMPSFFKDNFTEYKILG